MKKDDFKVWSPGLNKDLLKRIAKKNKGKTTAEILNSPVLKQVCAEIGVDPEFIIIPQKIDGLLPEQHAARDKVIYSMLARGFKSQEIADIFGISKATVQRVAQRRRRDNVQELSDDVVGASGNRNDRKRGSG